MSDVVIEANKYTKIGYVATGIKLFWDTITNRKKIIFKKLWTNATLKNCVKDYVNKNDAGLCIVTGEASNVIVVDCDVPKQADIDNNYLDGVKLFKELAIKYKLSPNTPVQVTPSGGTHMFFSMSKSLENGLKSTKNTTKIKFNGQFTTIDTRGDGGNIVVYPTKYVKNEVLFEYKWLVPLVKSDKLESMPSFLIDILNANVGKENVKTVSGIDKITKEKKNFIVPTTNSLFFESTKDHLENNLLMCKIGNCWDRTNGYDLSTTEHCTCPLCSKIHHSNNYMIRCVIDSVYYIKNYSSACKSQVANFKNNDILKNLIITPTSDMSFAHMLKSSFQNKDWDVIYTTNNRYLVFNKLHWCEVHNSVIAKESIVTSNTILSLLVHNIPKTNDFNKNAISQFKKSKDYVQKNKNIDSIMSFFKKFYTDTEIEDKINTNPKILVCRNGVVDLDTGLLREGKLTDFTEILVDYDYPEDNNFLTADIDKFLSSVFNDDPVFLRYMQKLLGYCITGENKEQIVIIFTGSGSNGKSLLVSILFKLLNRWICSAPRDLFFLSDKKLGIGAAAPHLLVLQNARMAIKEEASMDDVLNLETLKNVTGNAPITARGLYSSVYTTFTPFCKPILCCNHRPSFPTDDPAICRRLIVIPFVNTYTTADDVSNPYDSKNKYHRLRDNNLDACLKTESCQMQLLKWLVRGSVLYYKEGLGEKPDCITKAYQDYCDENDIVKLFIDEWCEVGVKFTVNASDFRNRLLQGKSQKVRENYQQIKLQVIMNKKGFKTDTHGTKKYKGLRFIDS